MRVRHTLWLIALGMTLLAACRPLASSLAGKGETTPIREVVLEPTSFSPPVTDSITVNLKAIPEVDTSQHSVPLEEVFFDTFRRVNRTVPLNAAQPELIRSLLDAIPPIYNPIFETAEAADGWLGDNDLVLGYTDGDQAFAYPLNILNFHEIVRQTVNRIPILITYCPLCRSGIVYDSRMNGETLLFGNTSALYESDMVMVDHKTGSYWMQVSGEAIVGPLTGSRMRPLPSQTTTWATWKQQYPHTFSLSRDTGYRRDYSYDPFADMGQRLNESGRFAFPVSEKGQDARLDPGEVVLGLEVDGLMRIYPLERFGNNVVNDTLGGTAVVVFSQSAGPTGAAYSPLVDGRRLAFELIEGEIQDRETGSIWNFAGEAVAGELSSAKLDALPSRSTFWFAIIAAFPNLEIYSPEE